MEKKVTIGKIVFKSIWVLASLFLWIGGLVTFFGEKSFGYWMMWGGMSIPMTFFWMVPNVILKSIKDNRREGARSFTVSSDGRTISNHPFLGAVFGFIAGIFVTLLLGPIAAPFIGIKSIVEIIKLIRDLK